jgi:hypothetical protein
MGPPTAIPVTRPVALIVAIDGARLENASLWGSHDAVPLTVAVS